MVENILRNDQSKIGNVYFDLGSHNVLNVVGIDANGVLKIRDGISGQESISYWVLSDSMRDCFRGINITGMGSRRALGLIKKDCHPQIVPHLPAEKLLNKRIKVATLQK